MSTPDTKKRSQSHHVPQTVKPPPVPEPPEPTHRDFIIISEFSELSGPDCLMVIPKDSDDGFDTGNYVMRIMSVDQNKGFDSSNIPQDTQSVIMHGRSSCYVHYFTLYDIVARGYVRPVCMSYITAEKDKIMENFEDIYQSFTRVSNLIKNANMEGFEDDLNQRIKELELKYAEFVSKGEVDLAEPTEANPEEEYNPDVDHSGVGLTPSIIRQYLEEMRSMVRRLNEFRMKNSLFRKEKSTASEIQDSTGEPQVKGNDEPEDDEGDQEEPNSSSDIMAYISKKHGHYEEKELRTFESLCNGSFKSALQLFKKILEKFRANRLVLAVEKEEEMQLRFIPSLLTFGKYATLNFDSNIYRNKLELKEIVLTKTAILENNTHEYTQHRRASATPSAHDLSGHLPSTDVTSSSHGSSPDIYVDAPDQFENEVDETFDDSRVSHVHTVCPGAGNNHSDSQRSLFESWKASQGKSVRIFARSLWNDSSEALRETSPLQFIRENQSLGKPLLYSILRGRPVFIQGTNENEVKDYIESLSLFVPGFHGSHTVVPLYQQSEKSDRTKTEKTTIRFVDLISKGMKLVGLNKKAMISPSALPYITYYDLDTKTLDAPEYKGNLLEQIFSNQKTYTSEETFKAHVHQALLFISMKVFLYYHLPLLVSHKQRLTERQETAPVPTSEPLSQINTVSFPETPEQTKTPPASYNPAGRTTAIPQPLSAPVEILQPSPEAGESKRKPKATKETPPHRTTRSSSRSGTSSSSNIPSVLSQYNLKDIVNFVGITKTSDLLILDALSNIVKDQQSMEFCPLTKSGSDVIPLVPKSRIDTSQNVRVRIQNPTASKPRANFGHPGANK